MCFLKTHSPYVAAARVDGGSRRSICTKPSAGPPRLPVVKFQLLPDREEFTHGLTPASAYGELASCCAPPSTSLRELPVYFQNMIPAQRFIISRPR